MFLNQCRHSYAHLRGHHSRDIFPLQSLMLEVSHIRRHHVCCILVSPVTDKIIERACRDAHPLMYLLIPCLPRHCKIQKKKAPVPTCPKACWEFHAQMSEHLMLIMSHPPPLSLTHIHTYTYIHAYTHMQARTHTDPHIHTWAY